MNNKYVNLMKLKNWNTLTMFGIPLLIKLSNLNKFLNGTMEKTMCDNSGDQGGHLIIQRQTVFIYSLKWTKTLWYIFSTKYNTFFVCFKKTSLPHATKFLYFWCYFEKSCWRCILCIGKGKNKTPSKSHNIIRKTEKYGYNFK